MATNDPLNRKLRMALVGGGQGAFIGRVHATAAVLDNRAALVAGALSSDAQRAKASAPDYDIPADRAYGSYRELIDAETRRSDRDRIDFLSVTTPNHTHFEIAKAGVDAGFNVISQQTSVCDLCHSFRVFRRKRIGAVAREPTARCSLRQCPVRVLALSKAL